MKKKICFAFVIILLAFCFRTYAALTLPTDYDEPVYYTAARYYAEAIQKGTPENIPNIDFNYEHPALAKIVYGAALSLLPSDGHISGDVWQLFKYQKLIIKSWEPLNLFFLRLVSVVFGTMAVAVLAIISPLAALALAIDSISIKYTSVIYLEALPLFLSVLSIYLFSESISWLKTKEKISIKGHIKEMLLLLASAACLGAATACKYQYGIVGLAIFFFYLIWIIPNRPKELSRYIILISFSLLSLVCFIASDPYLYSNPIANLAHSFEYSLNYQNGETVSEAAYPFYQPLTWLTHSVTAFLDYPVQPIPSRGNEFIFKVDTLIFILAVIGLQKLFKEHPLHFTWLIVGLAFLIIWNTKWPQYTMLVIIPLCLSSAQGVKTIIGLFKIVLRKVGLFQKTNKTIA